MSRAQVRDAFAVLLERRLLQREPHVGVTVVRLGAQEIEHVYQVRSVVEGLAARLAARNAPEGCWNSLRDRFGAPADRMIAETDFDGYSQLLDETHQGLMLHAANPVLNETMSLLADRSAVLARRSVFLPGRTDVGLRMHRDLIEALIARDEDAAERIKRANLADACERLIRFADYMR
ncbi:hypothetical protein GCM10011326_34350 [Salipiger profundus]|nr:hypothetical protein GCM10011326_34350 [Salipiger profundus]